MSLCFSNTGARDGKLCFSIHKGLTENGFSKSPEISRTIKVHRKTGPFLSSAGPRKVVLRPRMCGI